MSFITTKNLNITIEQLLGSKDDLEVILKDVKEVREYQDNKPTDKIIGYKYLVELPHNDMLFMYVKVLGERRITEQNIRKAGKIKIQFVNPQIKIYTDYQNHPALSVTAEDVQIMED